MTQCIPSFVCHCALFCQNVQSASFLNVKTFWASSYKICLLVQFCFWSFAAIFHIIIYTDPPHTYSFCIMTNLIMGKTVPLELVYPPFPQCFTSCGIAFMHITAILVNNSFIIHDFQLNNAQDSFVNLFYPSLIYSDYPLILFFIGFPLVDLNSVGYNLVSCDSASGWHKILVPHYSLGLCLSRSMWYVKYRKNGRWLYTWSHYMHRSIKWGVRVVQTPTAKIQIFKNLHLQV